MRYRGVLLRPLADQGDRDGLLIDPAGVQFIEGRDYPLTVDFNLDMAVGYAVISRAPDGSLVVEGAITDPSLAGLVADKPIVSSAPTHRPRLAAGIAFESQDAMTGTHGRVVSSCRLNAVGLTANHSDPGQPPIEEVEEP